jgi:hypothetical protein
MLISAIPANAGNFLLDWPCNLDDTYWFIMEPDHEEGILSCPGCEDQKALIVSEIHPEDYDIFMDPQFMLLRVRLYDGQYRAVMMKRNKDNGYLILRPDHLCGLLGIINSPRKALNYLEFLEAEMVIDEVFTGAVVIQDEDMAIEIYKLYDLLAIRPEDIAESGEDSLNVKSKPDTIRPMSDWDLVMHRAGNFFPTVKRYGDDFLVRRILLTGGSDPQMVLAEVKVSPTGIVKIMRLETLAIQPK